MRNITVAIFLTVFFCIPGHKILATAPEKEKTQEKESVKKDLPKEETSVTESVVNINGKEIKYTTTAGTQLLKDENGNVKASFFYVSYIKEGSTKNRPITFCFNGGPGSSSVWLNLGIFGPKRVNIDDEGLSPKQPIGVLDNPESILDVTDLVFIDPISTGYSKAADDPTEYHEVEKDVQSIAEFIRLYITRCERWDSPKFIAGESYGTTRAALLANELHDKLYLYLDGILLISTVLNFQTIDLSAGNDLGYMLYLPSYTAAALYHNRLSPEMQKDPIKTLADAEHFALNEYALSLLKGDGLTKQERLDVVKKLSAFTGLSEEYLNRSDLRVHIFRFAKELLKDQNRVIGRMDSRVKGLSCDPCSDIIDFDPSFDMVLGLFTATYNQYLRDVLKVKYDEEYKILTSLRSWNYKSSSNKYLNAGEKLQEVMSKNSNLQVFVASGTSDLATPYFSTQYTISHLGLDPTLHSNITLKNYMGGHMMYLYLPTLKQMKKDIAEFYNSRLKNDKAPL